MDLKLPPTQAGATSAGADVSPGRPTSPGQDSLPTAPEPLGTSSRWRALGQPAFLVGITAALGAYVWAVDPNQSTIFPACPFNAITGLDCPMCGSTRAVHALLHGEVGTAIDHNLLLVVLLPFLAYVFVAWAAGRAGYQLPKLWRPWMRWGAVAVVAAFLVTRNMPFEPFVHLDAAAGP